MAHGVRLRLPHAPAVVLVLTAAGALVGAGCGGPAADKAPAASRPPIAVTVTPVASADLQESVEVVGSLVPKYAADIKSEITGTVVEVYVTEWVPVRKGDRLARLDTSETDATIEALKATVAQAKVTEARAKREYERAQQLKEYGLITPQGFDDAKSAVEAAEAAVAAANAQVKTAQSRLAKSFITSPMDGVVAFRGVSVGDRVENMGGDARMFRIVDNRSLDLTVEVPSSRLSQVKIGQPLDFTTDVVPGRTFSGKVMFINPSLDASSRVAKVVAEVPNPDGLLRGGSFVKGQIVIARRSGVLQVPREALLNWNVEQHSAEVFLVRGDQVEKKAVKVGATGGGVVEITAGLSAGDSVVVRGGFALSQGDRVVIAKEGGA